MKRLFFILIAITFVFRAYSQVPVADVTILDEVYTLFDASKIADDTTHWFKIKDDKNPVSVKVEFSGLSNNNTYIDYYEGSKFYDTIWFNSVSGWVNDNYPLALDKTDSTMYQISESDTSNVSGIFKDYWEKDYIGVFIKPPSGGTTGKYRVIIER
jgi:hypothetical protein